MPRSRATAASFRPIAPAGNIIQTLQASGQFTTLLKALDATNLTSVVRSSPHLTLMAPTDAAFAAYQPTAGLLADLPGLQRLLLRHIINSEVTVAKFKDMHGSVSDGAGGRMVIDGTTPTFKADQANILQTDVRASNGLIDVVDQVLRTY